MNLRNIVLKNILMKNTHKEATTLINLNSLFHSLNIIFIIPFKINKTIYISE